MPNVAPNAEGSVPMLRPPASWTVVALPLVYSRLVTPHAGIIGGSDAAARRRTAEVTPGAVVERSGRRLRRRAGPARMTSVISASRILVAPFIFAPPIATGQTLGQIFRSYGDRQCSLRSVSDAAASGVVS
jgi:hypothetical protein